VVRAQAAKRVTVRCYEEVASLVDMLALAVIQLETARKS